MAGKGMAGPRDYQFSAHPASGCCIEMGKRSSAQIPWFKPVECRI